MKRFLVQNAVLREGAVVALDAEESAHAARVLRAWPGDRVRVFDGAGGEFEAVVDSVSSRAVTCRLAGKAQAAGETPVEITFAFGLAKRNATDWIIQKAVELGAARLRPFLCGRSVPQRKEHHSDNRLARWRRIIRDATKQCGRARLCGIEDIIEWPALLEAAPPGAIRVVCWEGAEDDNAHRQEPAAMLRLSESLVMTDLKKANGLWLAVGPEGGLTTREIQAAAQAGWQVCSLGPRILRAETAAAAALAAALAAMGDL